jgi:hypothetical protein
MNTGTYVEPDIVTALRGQLKMVRDMPVIAQGQAPGKPVTALAKGDYIRMGASVYLVEEKSEYREGKWKWHELHLTELVTGEPLFLEYEQDDRLETAVWTIGELELRDLGLTPGKLDAFDDNESGSFTYGGISYVYEESDEAFWKKGSGGEEIPFYYWDFYEKKGKRLISVEKWDDGSYDVSTGTEIEPRSVVYLTSQSSNRG